jgi:hypothetical protein
MLPEFSPFEELSACNLHTELLSLAAAEAGKARDMNLASLLFLLKQQSGGAKFWKSIIVGCCIHHISKSGSLLNEDPG